MTTPQQLNQISKAVGGGAMTQLKRQEMLRQVQAVPPAMRKFIARETLRSQVKKGGKDYYSVVRFAFNVAPVQPTVPNAPITEWEYTIAKKKVVAFSYGVQDDATAAGFPQGFLPTEAETNLIVKGDTGGSTVDIFGLSLALSETSDARLAKLLWANTFVDITLDGSNRHKLLGRMGRIPQSGGLYGFGESYVSAPPLSSTIATIGSMTNGQPMRGNSFRLDEPIRWNPSSKIDSKFQLRFEVVRDLRFRASLRPEAPGVARFQPPTVSGAEGTYVDVIVNLDTREISPRSTQA